MVSVDGDDGGDGGDGDGGDGGRRRRGRRGAELDCVGTGLAQTQTAPTSKMNEAGAEASVRRADHSSAALGCVMSAGTTHASNSSAVRKPSSRADSRSDRPL